MSNFAAVSAAPNNVTANGFPEFPGENPTKVQLEEWIEAWDEDMNQAGFGAFTRGELPYDVAKLVARPLLPVPRYPRSGLASRGGERMLLLSHGRPAIGLSSALAGGIAVTKNARTWKCLLESERVRDVVTA